ncbi:MAG: NAD(P)-binding domain-containing protein, partial [Bacteroidales bacterium]
MYKIGFIGLGIMGKPMALNLLKAGYQLIVYDIDNESVNQLIKAGAKEGKSSRDVASQSEVIITMLPNSPEVREVVLGKNGIIHGVRSGS